MQKQDQGLSSDRYHIIPRTLIFVTDQNKVLLIKGAPTKRIWANRYNGIGGHIEKGENIRHAAQLELLEETGLTVESLKLCATIMIDAGEQSGIGIFVFRSQNASGDLKKSEEGELSWIPLDQLSAYPLVEDLTALIPAVLELPPDAEPLAIHYTFDEQYQLVMHFNS
jgi:8-oxo-dGTP diphosphatase